MVAPNLDSSPVELAIVDVSDLGDILVVDDTPANLRLLVGLLNQHGYHARPAISGRLAVSGARTVPPDLILLDIMMPELDGYEVCAQLKADARTRDIPVIFVSALNEAVDKARAFAVGGADYIPKPFHPLEVVARVDNQLRLRATRRQLRDRNRQLQQFSANLKELHRLSTTNYASASDRFADYLATGCAIFGYTTGLVGRIDAGDYRVEAVHTDRDDLAAGLAMPLEETFCGEVAERQMTVTFSCVGEEPALRGRLAYQSFGFESYLSTPIWVNGELHGTLSFAAASPRSGELNSREGEILELMAESLGNFIATQQAEEQRQRAEQARQLLLNVTQAIAAAPNFEQALQAALGQVCDASGWSYGEVWLPAANQQVLVASPAWYSRDCLPPAVRATIEQFHEAAGALRLAAGEELPGRVWVTGEPEYYQHETGTDCAFLQRQAALPLVPPASLAVPILAPRSDDPRESERVLAVLVFCQFEPLRQTVAGASSDAREAELVAAIATQLGTAIQQKRAAAELKALFAAMDDLVMVYDRQGRCLKFATNNPSLLVRPIEEKLYKTLHENLPADVADRQLAATASALETQQTQSINYQLEIDGQMRWFSGKVTPLSSDTVMFVTRDISDIQQAQVALSKSEARFRAIFESAAMGIGVTNQAGDVLEANPALANFLGYQLADFQGVNLADCTYPDDRALDRSQFERVVSGEIESYQLEKRYVRADGQIVWGRLTGCSVWQDCQLAFLLGIVEDITERKRAEQALRDSEAEMRAIFAAMTDLVLLRDREGRCLKIAPTRAETDVSTLGELVGYTLHDTLPLPLADRLLRQIQIAIDTGEPTSLEYSVPVSDWSCWLDARISPLSADTVAIVARDITERKLIEQKLRTNEAELRSLFEAMTDIVLVVNLDRQELQIMPTRYAATYPSGQAILDATAAQFFRPTEPEIIAPSVAAALERQETVAVEYQLSVGEQQFWFSASISPLPNRRAILVARDISSRVRAEQELQRLATELEQRVIERTSQLRAANDTLRAEISDRMRAQAELAHSTEQLQAVLDAVPGFISWLGFDAERGDKPRYLGVNRLLADAFQRQPEAFSQQPVGFISQGSEFSEFISEFFHSPAPAASTVVRLPIDRADRHYLVVAQKYQQDRAAVSVGIDITARVEAEQRLQSAYQRLQLLSELTLKIRQSLDIAEILQTATQEVCQLLAADRVLIVERTAADTGQIVHESIRPGCASLQAADIQLAGLTDEWQVCQAGQSVAIADAEMGERDETERQFLATWQIRAKLVVPIFVQAAVWGTLTIHQCQDARYWHNDEIELLQQFADQIGIALSQAQLLDKLEERVAERTAELQVANQQLQQEIAERERVERALRHSEEQLRRAIDSNAYGMVVYTPTGTVRFMNRAAEIIFGGKVAQVQARFLELPLQSVEACELEIARSLGAPRIVEVRTVDMSWEGETAILASLMDITERKAIEQMKDEFLSVASHELRTPLTSIRGSLGLLATGRLGELLPKGSRMLEIAVGNADRLGRLIDDILDLERMKSGRVQIVKQDCQAGTLLRQALEAMQSMAEQAGVQLRVAGEQESAAIALRADPDQMLQTLTNLISNSIKFSQPGQCISLSAEQRDREVWLCVSDEGRGIPTEKLESIFGRFQQVDASDSREKGGTGLGLAICREIVERHGGRIWAESELGQGSQFYIALPQERVGV